MVVAADVRERARVAKQELARRELSRRQLIAFSWYINRQYQITRMHKMLAEYLEQVERYVTTGGAEGIGRLMVFMPPRHGKSQMVSVNFPAWFLGRNPDMRVVLASYTAALASSFSRQVRNIIADRYYRAVFGTKSGKKNPVFLSDDSRSADRWNLGGSHRGGMVSVGVGGSLTGFGANVLVVDDPVKDRAEAESKTRRDALWDWYASTAYTRLEKGGAVVVMHTRWHSDDLAGRLLQRMVMGNGADQWTVLNLPAIAEDWAQGIEPDEVIAAAKEGWWKGVDALKRKPGESLWPEKYPVEALEDIKANVGGYEWEALYQQRPRPVEGALIKANQITVIDPAGVPENLTEVRYWDLAVSGKQGADYIAGARVGRAKDGKLYILDVTRLPGPWADARHKMIAVMQNDPANVVQGIEIAGQQGGYFQELQRDPKLQHRALRGINPAKIGNKEVRANVWASRIPDGIVYMVRGNWNDRFVAEAIAFPRGAHDDQVDAVSGAVQMLGVGQVALGTAWRNE